MNGRNFRTWQTISAATIHATPAFGGSFQVRCRVVCAPVTPPQSDSIWKSIGLNTGLIVGEVGENLGLGGLSQCQGPMQRQRFGARFERAIE